MPTPQKSANSGSFLRRKTPQRTSATGCYAIPRASDLPLIAVESRDVPSPTNALGVKGAGEGGTVGAPGAVIHAILDALAPLGVTHLDMPATPERVWQAIERAAHTNRSTGGHHGRHRRQVHDP